MGAIVETMSERIQQRVSAFQQAVERLASTREGRDEVAREADRMSGLLGLHGLRQAGHVAAQIEAVLVRSDELDPDRLRDLVRYLDRTVKRVV